MHLNRELPMQIDHRAIAERAYQLWESLGRPEGDHEQIWMQAERELKGDSSGGGSSTAAVDKSLKDSFPASDPPASRLPDKPPSNAEEKWRAAGIDREPIASSKELERS